MQKSEQLYLLIHSMSKSEKRYLKVNSAKESSIYLKLFDAILEQENYDANALKELLVAEKTLSPLARVQHHLYQLLLKSLASFHAAHHPRYEVMDAIKSYIILRDRGLHEQGRVVLKKALSLAIANNYYGLVLEICDLMEDWVTEEDSYALALKQKESLASFHKKNSAYAQSVIELKDQVYELRLFFLEHQFARTKEHKKMLLDYVNRSKEQLDVEQNALKKRLLLTIHIYVYYGIQDYENLIKTEQKRLALLHQGWAEAHISPFLVYAYHRNLLWILLRNKNYKAHQNFIKNLDKSAALIWLASSSFYAVKLKIARAVTLMYAEVEQRHYHQAYHQIKDLWQLYEAHPQYWDMNLLVHSFILFINTTFCLGKYKETVHWLHLLEQDVPQSYVMPYRNMGKVSRLLIHDALGNNRFLENALESTRSRLYRKQDFFDVANVFLKYFKRKIKTSSKEAEITLLHQYKAELQELASQEEQKGFFILFNFVDWFDSKLENCTIADLNRGF